MAQEQPHSDGKAVEKRKISKGEKLFDAIVYGGMNYVGTFLITIPVAYSLEFGAARGAFNWAKSGLMNTLKWSENTADKVLKTTTLMQGGNVMLLPIQYCEDHKKEIVGKLNEMVGDKADPASIEAAPKQDAWSLIKSRALAWGVVFVSFTTAGTLFGKKMDAFEKWCGQKAADIFKKGETHREAPTNFADRKGPNPTSWSALDQRRKDIQALEREGEAALKKMGITAEVVSEEMKVLKSAIAKHETRTFAYGKLGAVDAFATAAAVALLYVGTRIFGKKHEDGHKEVASLRAPTRIAISKDTSLSRHSDGADNMPRPQVSDVAHEERLEVAPARSL